MHAYFRNHQLYLAEKCEWVDRHVVKTSKRALLKIESWKSIKQAPNNNDQMLLMQKMMKESLLTPIPNRTILRKEGFYASNLDN